MQPMCQTRNQQVAMRRTLGLRPISACAPEWGLMAVRVANGRKVSLADAAGHIVQYLPGSGDATQLDYDTRGQVWRITMGALEPHSNRVSSGTTLTAIAS
jgi:YD repeat-containing protein